MILQADYIFYDWIRLVQLSIKAHKRSDFFLNCFFLPTLRIISIYLDAGFNCVFQS